MGRCRFESLLIHVALEWLLAAVGRSRFESLLVRVAIEWLLATVAFFAMTPFDGKCQNLQMSPSPFCASSYRLQEINILNF